MKCPVIARIDPGSKQAAMTVDCVTLFFPYDPANSGNLSCYARVGQHSEAHLTYYWKTRAPRTNLEKAAASEAIRQYRAHLAAILMDGEQLELVERQRLPHNFRKHAWEHA